MKMKTFEQIQKRIDQLNRSIQYQTVNFDYINSPQIIIEARHERDVLLWVLSGTDPNATRYESEQGTGRLSIP